MKKDKILKLLMTSPILMWLIAYSYSIAFEDPYVTIVLLKILGVAIGTILILLILASILFD